VAVRITYFPAGGLVASSLPDVDIGAALADGDVETGVAIETLLERRVIASELELMFPFELQRYLIQRSGRMRCQQDQASGHD
jgi:hypothetical protein